MTDHDDKIRLRHMLDHAQEARENILQFPGPRLLVCVIGLYTVMMRSTLMYSGTL